MTAADISESGQPSCQQGETVSTGQVWQSKNQAKKWQIEPVTGGMMRTIGISLVGAFMAVQLLFLYTRHVLEHETRDYPRIKLPVAKNSTRHCSSIYYENISWTQKGGWTVYGKGKVSDQDLDQFLRSEVERHKEKGNVPGMRVRIPANAPAGIFVNLTKRMEEAGVVNVRVAVVRQRFASL